MWVEFVVGSRLAPARRTMGKCTSRHLFSYGDSNSTRIEHRMKPAKDDVASSLNIVIYYYFI